MSIKLEIWGSYACFTRPECKVERMSYPVPTPSAMRGVVEAIYWKPEITWVIDKIRVLNPICWTSLIRNEVSPKASYAAAQADRKKGKTAGIYIEDCRQQRHSLILRDVRYVISAHFVVHTPGPDNTAEKHLAIFTRRAERGQHYTQPYMGCREFAAFYRLCRDESRVDRNYLGCREFPANYDLANEPLDTLPRHQRWQDLGMMVHDISFEQDAETKVVSKATTHVFHAVLRDGLITVPHLTNGGRGASRVD